jgi:hypothetical protein
MSRRLKALWSRYAEARADVDASNAEGRRASAMRLAELLKSTDRSALVAGLRDPALIPFDRAQLENAIAVRLPRRRIRIPLTIVATLRLGARHARYHWRGLVLFTLIATPVIATAGIAWENTGEFKVTFANEWIFDWRFPDGHTEAIPISAGAAVVAMHQSQDGQVLLRLWDPNAGYGRAVVPGNWFSEHAQIWKRSLLDAR